MREIIVALDLETTGLSKQDDTIIQVGAVKFQGDQIIARYDQLVNPERPIPPYVINLTGITNEQVATAPVWRDVQLEVAAFIGDAPILGHNVGFDVEFLRSHKIPLKKNVMIDTYELASVLLPTIPRYNLNAVTQQLGLVIEGDFHSALTDADASRLAYLALWETLLTVPRPVLLNIVEAAKGLNWLGALPFEAALTEPEQPATFSVPRPVLELPPRTPPVGEGYPIIAETLTKGGQLFIEAGAGLDRTAGYLIPVVNHVASQDERVMIATYNHFNHDYQNQLIHRDLPAISAHTGHSPTPATLKDRNNYLCPRRLETLRRRPPTNVDELRVLAKILVWGEGALKGDRQSISLRGVAENRAWVHLSAADERCTLDRCSASQAETGVQCPYHAACQSADSAQILFIDHKLLFTDEPLPTAPRVIIDEANKLEESATYALSSRLDLDEIKRLLADLGNLEKGLLADLFRVITPALSEKQYTNTQSYLTTISEAIQGMERQSSKLFTALNAFLKAENAEQGDYLNQFRLTEALRERSAFTGVRNAWAPFRDALEIVAGAMGKLAERLVTLKDRLTDPALPDVIASVAAASHHLVTIQSGLTRFIEQPDENVIYWLEISTEYVTPVMRTAPLHIKPMMNKELWKSRGSVIMTGSVLTAGGTFDLLREAWGAPYCAEVVQPLPYDYKNVLVYLVSDMPEPADKTYGTFVTKAISELALGLEGRVTALFTSSGQVRQTAVDIVPLLGSNGITLLNQSDGTARQTLLEQFHTVDKPLLLASRPFWDEAEFDPVKLAGLVIARFPFTPPSDVIFTARAESISESFNQFSVPDAILKFRQGFDRLSCPRAGLRGVVLILDKRAISKPYGQTFLESVPEVTVQRGRLADIRQSAAAWVREERNPTS
jgi:DNA polymerase-3 subunit epsilon/ATP-dependent DNA helicase DinG